MNIIKTAYYPLTDKTNKYVKLVVDSIKENKIEVIDANINRVDKVNYEIINLNWYESIFEKNYLKGIKQYFNKLSFLKKLKQDNVKIIWTVHNKIPHDGKYKYFAIKLMNELIIKSDAIVIHCKDTVEVLENINSTINIKDKVHYIPHPNYIGAYDEKEIDFRSKFNIEKDEMVFLFAGQVRPYKNVELIIKAAKTMVNKKVKFIIAGRPSGRLYEAELKKLIGNNSNIITMFQYIDDSELVPLIKASDVVLLPYNIKSSLNSGVAILSFTYGRTIVCPKIGTLNDLEDDSLFYSYMYVDEKEHAESLIRKVNECYNDFCKSSNILKEKGNKLKYIMEKDYSKLVVAEKYNKLYRELVERHDYE